MKFSFNLDLALIISIFTAFLFWCGYWYSYGYLSFFHIPINFLELNLSTLAIEGLLTGIDTFAYLLMAIILLSFVSGFSKKDADFSFNFLTLIIASFLIFINYHIYTKYKLNKYRKMEIKIYPYTYSFFQKNHKRLFSTNKKKKSKFNFFGSFKSFTYTNKRLEFYQMRMQDISKRTYGNETSFDINSAVLRFGLHYFGLLFILTAILYLFNLGQNLHINGSQTAQQDLENSFSTKIPEDRLHKNFVFKTYREDDKESPYKLTSICNKDVCAVVNKEKEVKFIDLKKIEILPSESKK